jgi:hypothetical protein
MTEETSKTVVKKVKKAEKEVKKHWAQLNMKPTLYKKVKKKMAKENLTWQSLLENCLKKWVIG